MNNDIIEVIEKNLTGDFDHDFEYLMKEASHFQKMKGSEAIVKAILDLFQKHLGEKGRERMMEIASSQIKMRQSQYKKALDEIKNKNYTEASSLLTNLIDTFPFNRYDKQTDNKQFNHIVERILYKQQNNITNVHQYEEPVSVFYYQLAITFRETNDLQGTLEMLDKAIELNPVCFDYLVLKADTLKRLGNVRGFIENMCKALSYAFLTMQFARGYFLLAAYYEEIGNLELAYYLYERTTLYSDMNLSIDKLREIKAKDHKIVSKSMTEVDEILKAYNIPLVPTKEVLKAIKTVLVDTSKPGLEKIHNSIQKLYNDITKIRSEEIQ